MPALQYFMAVTFEREKPAAAAAIPGTRKK
jgi:hypothetical protein